MRIRAMVSAAATVAALGAFAAPSHALVQECTTTGTADFHPALTEQYQEGKVYVTYQYACVVVRTNGIAYVNQGYDPVDVRMLPAIDYKGSCLTATFTRPGEIGYLIGGTLAVGVMPNASGARVSTLVPRLLNTPCSLSSAYWVNTGPDLVP